MRKPFNKRVLFCHGYRVGDGGENTIDTLIEPISKFAKVKDINYGKFKVSDVLRHNDTVARVIASFVEHGDVFIGHSNACALGVKAAGYGAQFSRMILINPALKSDIEFPDHIKHIDVFHTEHDVATQLARYLRWVTPWCPDFIWGEMGHSGYTGNDDRVNNIDMSARVKGHSSIFTDENIKHYLPIIKEKIKHS